MKMYAVLALAVLMAPDVALAKKSSRTSAKGKSVMVRAVYTMDGCPHCTVLERALRGRGARLSKSYTDDFRFESYPTVIYSDGRTDQGQRVLNRRAGVPGSVRVVEAQ